MIKLYIYTPFQTRSNKLGLLDWKDFRMEILNVDMVMVLRCATYTR